MTTMHRLTLDPTNVTVQQHLARPHRIYGALMMATDGAGHAVGGDARVLYRIERSENEKEPVQILIQSNGPIPKPQTFSQYGAYKLDSKSMLPVIQFIEDGHIVKFSIRLNPVARRSRRIGERERMEYRIITKSEEVVTWATKLLGNHGFEILKCKSTSENAITGKDAKSSVNVVRIEGIAEIIDQAKAKIAVTTGIGRAKISGCGMILLGRA